MVTFILLHIFHVIIRLLIPNTVVVHFLYTTSEITSMYIEMLVQYHSKATDTVCSIKLKREEFLSIRTIFNFQAECVLIYMLLFYQISAWAFLIHMFLYAGFYCSLSKQAFPWGWRAKKDQSLNGIFGVLPRGGGGYLTHVWE